MPRISLWKPTKGNDYNFIDRVVGEHLYAGGTGVFVHKYLGVHTANASDSDAAEPGGSDQSEEIFIQDLIFLENRDRKYDDDVYELRGQYDIPDTTAFDITQIGFLLDSGALYMTFHENNMVDSLGRRLMPGDVLELPHLRDDLVLGQDEAINRFYVVMEGARPAEGYDPRWWSHLWRVRLSTITDSQEYRDILGTGEEEGDLRDIVSKRDREIEINDAVIAKAEEDVPYDPRYMETGHYYFDPEVPDKPFTDRGGSAHEAINGIELLGSGSSFPMNADDGDFFLRTDFQPNRLFEKSGTRWLHVGTDNRRAWTAANRVLTGFINNDAKRTNTDGTEANVKTNLSKVVLPRSDT